MTQPKRHPLPRALLLLGPTGSGKTPLGELLEVEGLGGLKCHHFDFGSQLRTYAAAPSGPLSESELEVVKTSLRTGALLTDDQFVIAEKLLSGFIRERRVGCKDLVFLNGLPRHGGQAAAIADLIDVIAVAVLECSAATVLERIRTDAGGDRGGRIDDSVEEVKNKLAIFAERTMPLVEYYRFREVPVLCIPIGGRDTAAETLKALERRLVRTLA